MSYHSKTRQDLMDWKDYESKYKPQLDTMFDQIMNRPDFKYDLNQDALYKQYKDQYIRNGKLAMMDTVGQVSALTGGYGNSYAQTAGQQAFQGYLTGLNDKVPELYSLAMENYDRQGNDMLNRYGVLQGADDKEYGRYQDSYHKLLDQYNREYGEYRDHKADEQWREQMEYQKNRDAIADQHWQADRDYQKMVDERNHALQLQKLNSRGSDGSSNKGGDHIWGNVDRLSADLKKQGYDDESTARYIYNLMRGQGVSDEIIKKTLGQIGL